MAKEFCPGPGIGVEIPFSAFVVLSVGLDFKSSMIFSGTHGRPVLDGFQYVSDANLSVLAIILDKDMDTVCGPMRSILGVRLIRIPRTIDPNWVCQEKFEPFAQRGDAWPSRPEAST